jgi:hypothetical protein
MHHKLTKHGRFCKQNNQLPTKTHVELKDNSNEILANPPSYSRVSSLSEECLLQLQIVSTKVMTTDMEEGVNFLYLDFFCM